MQTVVILMQMVFLLRGSRAWSDLIEHGFVFSTDGSDSLSVGRCAREYRVPLLVLVLILTYVPVVLHLVLGTASGPPCIAADSGVSAGSMCTDAGAAGTGTGAGTGAGTGIGTRPSIGISTSTSTSAESATSTMVR